LQKNLDAHPVELVVESKIEFPVNDKAVLCVPSPETMHMKQFKISKKQNFSLDQECAEGDVDEGCV